MTRGEWHQLSQDEKNAMLMELVTDSICPVMCECDEGECGCETEPDGDCEHGCESVLLALELI